ncbi:MAG: hypothetical protein AAGN35_15800 [Bacteroidota bacterium]
MKKRLPYFLAGIGAVLLTATALFAQPLQTYGSVTLPRNTLYEMDSSLWANSYPHFRRSRLLNYHYLVDCMYSGADDLLPVGGNRPRYNTYRLRVDTTGKVSHVCHNLLWVPEMDKLIRECIGMLKFESATHEGKPIPSWTTLPVKIEGLLPQR